MVVVVPHLVVEVVDQVEVQAVAVVALQVKAGTSATRNPSNPICTSLCTSHSRRD